MISLSRSTVTLLAWALCLPIWAQDADIPRLIVPEKDADFAPPGVLRAFGSQNFRVPDVESSSQLPFFSPDGKTIYVPRYDGLRAFDAEKGNIRFHYDYGQLNLTVRNQGAAGIHIAFSQGPLAGKYVVLEHGTGKELKRGDQVKQGKLRPYLTFAEGRRALRSEVERGDIPTRPTGNQTAYLYDSEKDVVLAKLGLGGHRNSFLSRDERLLAFRTDGMELRVFDTDEGKRLQSLPLGLDERYGESTDPRWSQDGKTVYVWRRHEERSQIVALDVGSGKVRVMVHDERKRVFSAPVVSPDGKHLAYRLGDNPWEQNSYWRIVRLSDLSEVHTVDIRPAKTQAAFSPNGLSFWLVGGNGLARFDLETGKLDSRSVDPFSPTHALSFSSDSKKLLAVNGRELITWDATTGRETQPRGEFDDYYSQRAHMRCLYVSGDGRQTIWKGPAGDSHVHALLDGRKVSSFYASNTQRQREFDLTANYRLIVHDAYHGELKLADLWTGKTVRELLPKVRPRENFRMALAPDNRTMALFHRDHRIDHEDEEIEIELWDITQGRKTGSIRQVAGNQMTMQFSADSRELRIWHRARISVWSVASRTLLRRQPCRDPHYRLFCTNNRHWLITPAYRPTAVPQIDLVDIHTGQVARTWDRPQRDLTAVAFAPDMSLFAVAGAGSSADLYQFYEPRPDAKKLQAAPAAELIEALAGNDAQTAFDAMCELIRRGDDAVPAIRAALLREPARPEEVAKLIEQLDDDDFHIREAATKKLSQASISIDGQLAEALKGSSSPESVARLKSIQSGRHPSDVSPTARIAQRCVEALAAMNTAASRELLELIAKGNASVAATHEARATLARRAEGED